MARDIFISYSYLDAPFVEKLARQLKSKGVSLWLDRYEIKPGEYVRDRINEGIANAEYFIAVLSPNSLGSQWVRHEIDAAMTRELGDKRVRLIPLLRGSLTAKDLPVDIRGKNYLDFRTEAKAKSEIARLLTLLKPKEKLRKQFLQELRTGLSGHSEPFVKLHQLLCTYHDQGIQRAAARGLVGIGTSQAAVAIVQRLCDFWGCASIRTCIRALELLKDQGGLIAIASTIFWDDRFLSDKLNVLKRGLKDESDFVEFLEKQSTGSGIPYMSITAALLDHSPLEISAAFRFSSQYWLGSSDAPFWMPKLSASAREKARSIVDGKLPGLTDFIATNLVFRGMTESESKDWMGAEIFELKRI